MTQMVPDKFRTLECSLIKLSFEVVLMDLHNP